MSNPARKTDSIGETLSTEDKDEPKGQGPCRTSNCEMSGIP